MTRAAIVGAGFGGICMGVALSRAGIDTFRIVDKGAQLGGTWRDNTYPGAACDVPSHLYSYSFEPKHDWSRAYAEQPQILAYLEHVAEKYGLRDRIELATEVREASWDERARQWCLVDQGGRTSTADVIVLATGQLNRPHVPRLPGRETFAGVQFHSARWDASAPLEGARVGVVGSGASAIQFLPRVASRASRLTLFQRTPAWILPKYDRSYSRLEHWLVERAPAIQALSRKLRYAWGESRLLAFRKGSRYNQLVRFVATRHLEDAIADPALRRILTPDYPPGCKRLLISNDWYEALARPNVSVVTAPIREVVPRGVVTADGALHELDVVVYGTGFETTAFLAPMSIRGRGGALLEDAWKAGAEAYLGMTVPRFPNLFVLYGPNTNLAHNSIIVMLEAQARYVVQCVQATRARGAAAIEVRESAMRTFVDEMQRRFRGSIWEAGCSSWYRNEAGRHTNNWPGSTLEYRWRTRRPDLSAYAFT